MRDLVIIGSGPAGLSAAIYAKRAKLDVVVIEKAGYSGGQIITTERIDNYLGLPEIDGFSLGNRFREHADKLEAEFIAVSYTHLDVYKRQLLNILKNITTLRSIIRDLRAAIGMRQHSEFSTMDLELS